MTAAKCAAPPSGRSSRSTVVTTTWRRPSRATASATRVRLVMRPARPGMAGGDVAEAQARVQISPMIIMVAWRCDQHSPMLGQAASSQTVARRLLAHQGLGFVVDRMGGRLDPDPRRLALDRVVRPVRLLRMAEGRGEAVIDDDVRCHDANRSGGCGVAASRRGRAMHTRKQRGAAIRAVQGHRRTAVVTAIVTIAISEHPPARRPCARSKAASRWPGKAPIGCSGRSANLTTVSMILRGPVL